MLILALLAATAHADDAFLLEALDLPSIPYPAGATGTPECTASVALPDNGDEGGAGAQAAAAARAEGNWTPDPQRSGRDAGGHFVVNGVTGCDEPFLSATSAYLAAAVADSRASRLFGGRTFDVRVIFAPPGVSHRTTAPVPRLDAATRVEVPPEKVFDAPPNRPRDVKGGRCAIEVWIDELGAPYAIDESACRDDLQLLVEFAVMGWRYTPVQIDGRAVPARFTTDATVK